MTNPAPRILLHVLLIGAVVLGVQLLADSVVGPWNALAGGTRSVWAEQSPPEGTGSRASPPTPKPGRAASTLPVSPVDLDGPDDSPPKTSGAPQPPAPTASRAWRGTAAQAMYLRAAPRRNGRPLGELRAGEPVEVARWVAGEEVERDNPVWAELTGGAYVYSAGLQRAPLTAAPTPPVDAPTEGRWIDVNLTEQVATAYEGRRAVKSVLISSGRPGWPTPVGSHRVMRRVENETMDGSTLVGQGPNGAGASYRVENVRFTQYFAADGSAIHENSWRRPSMFGIPGSHGCIGMQPRDAAWFWEFATVGTPVLVHE